MANPLPRTLNLLQPAETPVSSWDKIYNWVFTVGRYVVIVVELVVLVMFASRFVLDRQNNDLIQEIDVKVQMLEAQKETERQLRGVQATLSNLDQMVEDQKVLSPGFENLLDQIPSGVTVESFSISQISASISGRAPSYEVLKEFEVSLREDSSFEKVTVNVEKSGSYESEVNFEISIYLTSEA